MQSPITIYKPDPYKVGRILAAIQTLGTLGEVTCHGFWVGKDDDESGEPNTEALPWCKVLEVEAFWFQTNQGPLRPSGKWDQDPANIPYIKINFSIDFNIKH